jgi:putative DNA primase/helicase
MSKCLDPLLEWGKSEDERLKDEIIKAKSRRASEEKIIEGLRSSLKKTPLEKQEFIIQKIIKLEQFLTEIPRVIDLFTSDITQEKLGVALMDNFERFAFISDEGGVFDSMKGRYNTQGLVNMDLFLKAHAGTADRVLRMDRSVYLEKPALTFCVSPQPSVLADLSKTKEFRGKGLTARFLFSVPKSLVGERTGGQPMEESVRLAYRDNIFKLLNKRPVKIDGVIQSNELNMTEEARELWQSFSNDIESNLGKGGELEELKDWGSKLPGATARIAGLLHLAMHVDADEPWKILVSKDTMFESILIAEYLIPHAKAAFGIISEDPDITKAKKILEWMRDLGSNQFTQRQCHNALQRTFPRVVDLQKILNILLERSYITELKNRKATPRASKVFEINPAALSST